ncbi:exo-alpha-sialidase [Trypanosoma cruzi]|nr:exo-alpha-sialidase [Trypanosoma cruzi]
MDERISTASIHSERHHHPRRSHSQQQKLTHTDTRNEKEEQCTGNTQRLPPPAGVTAGVLSVTRQHTPSNAHTQINQREAKERNRPSQHRHAAARRLILVPPSHPLLAHITPHIRGILRRRKNSERNTSAARAAAGREAIRTPPRQRQCHAIHDSTPRKSRSQHGNKTNRRLPSCLLARAAAAKILWKMAWV